MNPAQFERSLKQKQQELRNYVYNTFPGRAGNISLRFINGNFRAQGWQGTSFNPWKKNARNGTILVKRGHLRRGTYFTQQPGQAHIKNNVKYAAVHNNGYTGTVMVKAHQRRLMQATRVGTGKFTPKGKERRKTVHTVKGVANVKAHSRKMNIPRRQFMPNQVSDSPVLANAIRREIERELKKIF